jgi:hypothetical protein
VPPEPELPHAVIEPPALRAATVPKIYSTWRAFAALKADGSITAWGNSDWGGTGTPSDNGYTKIYSAWYAFAALKADGSCCVVDCYKIASQFRYHLGY